MLSRKKPTSALKPSMPRVTEGGRAGKVISSTPNLERMPRVTNDSGNNPRMVSITSPLGYSSIKKTREVNKVYKTY